MSTKPFSPLSEQDNTVRALLALVTQFPDLPTASFQVNPYIPELTINVHNDPAGFEQWRESLGLDPQTSTEKDYRTFYAVEVPGEFAGVGVELVGYMPIPIEHDAPAAAA
ncbi:hypothetical protein [Streptacidiphilus rugosus]|uniref:hypothetical protein n=1 Tax=Streptacidiphilus rugosus TaxID=405783 RepID=UPI000566731F|nr:hypothetical protein [Streptacidiphilus rugosus]